MGREGEGLEKKAWEEEGNGRKGRKGRDGREGERRE